MNHAIHLNQADRLSEIWGPPLRFFTKLVYHLAEDFIDDLARLEMPDASCLARAEQRAYELADLSVPKSSDGYETYNYSLISDTITGFLDAVGAERLTLIIDEWAEIPLRAQPYFAEFLKRAFFGNAKITIKVSLVEYQHQLSVKVDGQWIGLERSADIFSDVRMDGYFVWDEDREFVEGFFSQVLYNHMALGLNVSVAASPEVKRETILRDVFTQRQSFSELCRASEGNTRDYLVVFGKAYAEFQRQHVHQKIGLPDVHAAASKWYRQEKHANIATESHLDEFLIFLVNDIIKEKKSRTFMVPYRDVEHPTLRELFAARILHPLPKVWSHPDRPGERYILVQIDFGTYVDLKGTRAEPREDYLFDNSDPTTSSIGDTDLVPYDDRRSIRRIVVGRDVLDRYRASTEA